MRRLCSLVIFATALSLSFVAFPSAASAAADLDTVVAELGTNRIYVEEGANAGDMAVLNAAAERALVDNINLYVVVLADDTSGVKARAVQERLGTSTVLLFSPKIYDFESVEICAPRFDEASANADTEITSSTPDEATQAFIAALSSLPPETCDSSSSDGASGQPWWLWILVFLAAAALLVFLWAIYRAIGSSRRAERDAVEFNDRRRILKEWADTLRGPITELQVPVAQAKSSSLAAMFNDALKVARESGKELDAASSLPELDRAEIRIARAHMQVRDVRKALDR